MDLLGPCRVDPIHQSPRSRTYGYFTHRTDPPSSPFPIFFVCCLPQPIPLPIARSQAFPCFRYHAAVRLLAEAPLPISLALIGSLPPEPPEAPPVLLRSHVILPYRAARNHHVSGG